MLRARIPVPDVNSELGCESMVVRDVVSLNEVPKEIRAMSILSWYVTTTLEKCHRSLNLFTVFEHKNKF